MAMANLLKRLLREALSREPDTFVQSYQAETEAIAQRTVARFSRGNATLQGGRYLTQETLDQRRTALRIRAK